MLYTLHSNQTNDSISLMEKAIVKAKESKATACLYTGVCVSQFICIGVISKTKFWIITNIYTSNELPILTLYPKIKLSTIRRVYTTNYLFTLLILKKIISMDKKLAKTSEAVGIKMSTSSSLFVFQVTYFKFSSLASVSPIEYMIQYKIIWYDIM